MNFRNVLKTGEKTMKRTTISMLLAAPVLALVMGGCSMESASAASDTASVKRSVAPEAVHIDLELL